MTLLVIAYGRPAPQGSMKSYGNGRMVHSNAATMPWRDTVIHATRAAMSIDHIEPTAGPVSAVVNFYFTRPKNHFAANGGLRPKSPAWPTSRAIPDTDKLQRAVGDALEASGYIANDAQIVCWLALKKWCSTGSFGMDTPGMRLELRELTP